MTKGTLRHLGLCMALALLFTVLFGVSALADGPWLEDLGIYLSSPTVVPTDEVDVYYEDARTSDDNDADIAYTLHMEGVTDPEEEIDVSDIAADHHCFTVPASRLTAGHSYRAVVTAAAEGYESQEARAQFLVSRQDSRFRVELWVDGEMGFLHRPVTQNVDIHVRAGDAEEVIFGNGHGWEENLRDFGFDDYHDVHFDYFWDYENFGVVYARARFHDRFTGEDVWVTSEAVIVSTHNEHNQPLPAPQLTLGADSLAQGDILTVTAQPVPQGAERLVLQVYNEDGDCRFEEEYWRDDSQTLTAELPTAHLAEGNYHLNAWWRGVGYISDSDDNFPFSVTAYEGAPYIASLQSHVVPHEGYTLYGAYPGADGVCVFEGWEIREVFEGQDSFYWTDGCDDIATRTYTLGVWDADMGAWARVDDINVTVEIGTDDRLPELNIEGLEAVDGGALREGDALALTVRMTDPDAIDPWSIGYNVRVIDTENDDHLLDEGFNLGPDDDPEDDYDPSFMELRVEGDRFEIGRCYRLEIEARSWGYPTERIYRDFTVLPGDTGEVEFEIHGDDVDGDDENQLTVSPNADNVIVVRAPGAQAVQLYWDYGWQNVDPGCYDEEEECWRWVWSLDNPGDQLIYARVTYDEMNWEDGVDWDRINWHAYSDVQQVTVADGELVELPHIELKTQTVTRGDTLLVIVGPNDDHIKACNLDVFAENEWGEYWDHRYGEQIYVDHTDDGICRFVVPTMDLEPGRYRVQIYAMGESGYVGQSTGYNDPWLYFNVNPFDGSRALLVAGPAVTGSDGAYQVPVHRLAFISGCVEGAGAVCLYQDDEIIDEWWGTESFSRVFQFGNVESHTYGIGVYNEEADNWDRLELNATLSVTAEYGKLEDPVIDCAPTATLGDDYTFSFSDVTNAGWYYVNVRDAFDERDSVYEADISAEESRTITLTDTHEYIPGREYVIRVSSYGMGWDGGYAEKRFLALKPSDGGDGEVSLDLYQEDGPEDAEGSFYVNQDVSFTLNAPGATFAQVYWDNDWRNVDAYRWHNPEDDFISWNWSLGWPGEYNIVARVTDDGRFQGDFDWNEIDWENIEWTGYSEPVCVNFTCRDELHLPDVSIDRNEVTRGDMLNVTLGAPDSALLEHTNGFNIHIFDAEGDWRWEDRWYAYADIDGNGNATEIALPTMQLAPGLYRVHVDLDVHEGYFAEPTDESNRDLWFTVNDRERVATIYATKPGDDTHYTGTKKMNVNTLTDFDINAFVPGANGVAILHEGEVVTESGGEGVYYSDFWPFTGEHTYTVCQWNSYDEQWDPVENLKAVANVVKDPSFGADLAPAVIGDVPEYVVAGSGNLEFTVHAGDDTTERVFVRVFPEDDPDDQCLREWPDVNGAGDVKTFSLDTDRLMPGRMYIVAAQAQGAGHQAEDSARAAFMATDSEPDGDLILTLPTVSDPMSLTASKDYTANIQIHRYDDDDNFDAPTIVEFFNGGWWDRLNLEDDESFEDYDRGFSFDSGLHAVQFRATWDDEDYLNNFDWENQDWNRDVDWHYSNAITVRMNSNGQVAVPTVSLVGLDGNHCIDQGGTFTVKLSNIPTSNVHISNFSVSIVRLQDDRQFFWKNVNLTGNKNQNVSIDLDNLVENQNYTWPDLRPGKYRVHVHVQGKPGYDSNWTDGGDESLWFTVNDVVGVRSWDSWTPDEGDIWSDLTNEITTTTCRDYLVHAEVEPGHMYCFYDGNEREEEWYQEDYDPEESCFEGGYDMRRGSSMAGDHTYYLGAQDEDGNWYRMDWTAMTVHVVAAGGDLDKPTIIEAPATLTEDDPFTFTFQGIDNMVPADENDFAGYYIEVRDEDGWRPIYDSFYSTQPGRQDDNPESVVDNDDGTYTVTVTPPYVNDYEDWNGEMVHEEYHVLPGHRYTIRVHANRLGWNGSEDDRRVICMGEDVDDQITLEINPTDTLANADVDIHVAIPGREYIDDDSGETQYAQPTRVELLLGEWNTLDEWRLGDWFNYDFTDLHFTWEAPSRSATAVLRATWDSPDELDNFDWDNQDWNTDVNWVYSNAVPLTIERYGQVDLPEYSVMLNDEHKVIRGEPIEIAFGDKPDHVREYHVSIHRLGDGEHRFSNAYNVENGSILLPTDFLDEFETYFIEIHAHGEPGWDGNNTSWDDVALRFRVMPGGGSFFADKEEVLTCESILLSAYWPDANGLRFVRADDRNDQRGNGGGDNLWENYEFDRAGDYTFILEEDVGDDNWDYRSEVTVHVSAPNGDLETPVIHAPGSLPADGESDLTFTVEIDENAEELHVDVWDCNDDYCVADWHDVNRREFTVPADRLQADHEYNISVGTRTRGMNAAWRDANCLVIPAEDSEYAMRLTVNDSDEDQTILSNEEYRIHFWVETPGGESFTDCQQLFWDGEWRDMWPDEDFDGSPMDGTFTRSDGENTRTIMMRCSFNGGATWVYSNAVVLNITAEGYLPDPEVEIINLQDDRSIPRGDNLQATISLPQDCLEHVDSLNVAVFAPNEWGDYEDRVFDMRLNADATETSVPTLSLWPGQYYLEIWVNGVPGWNSSGTHREDESLYFEVTDSGIEQPTLQVELTEAPTFTYFNLVGYVPGADSVALFVNGNHWTDEGGETIVREDVWSQAGTYTYQLAVWSDSIDDWRVLDLESCTATVTITAKGDLAAPVVTGSSLLTYGEDLNFDVENVANAQWFRIHVGRQDDWGDEVYNEDFIDVRNFEDGKFHVRVPAEAFDGFITGDRFEINAQANANNYNSNDTSLYFTLVDPADDSVGLSIPDLPADGEVKVNQNLRVHLTTDLDNPTFAQIYWDREWRDLWPGDVNDDYSDCQFTWGFGWPGQQSILARVTEDNIDETDWENINWTYSAPIDVDVQVTGEMPDIIATLDKKPPALRRGDSLTVSIRMGEDDERENVDHFDVMVFGRDYENGSDEFWRELQRMHFTGDTTEAVIPTAALDVDTYRIQVHAFGKVGVQDKETAYEDSSLYFRVKPAIETLLSFTVTETEVPVLHTYAVSAFVPGASRVQLFENGNPWIHWDDQGEHEYWEGERLSAEVRQDRGGLYRYTLKAFDWDNNEMYLDYQPIVVNVTTQGQLADAVVAYDATPSAGEDFTFTVQPVENGTIYYIRVVYDESGDPIPFNIGNGTSVHEFEGNLAADGPLTGVIPADRLEAGRNYRIEVHVAAEGWTATDKSHPFTPVDPSAKALTLTVEDAGAPDANGVHHILSQHEVTFCVTAEGNLEGVQLAWESWKGTFIDMEPQDDGSWTAQVGDNSNRRVVYAKAILNGNEVVSNSITLEITGETMPAPSVTLNTHNGQIIDGDTLTVTIDPVDWVRVNTYFVGIYGAEGDTMFQRQGDYLMINEGSNRATFDLGAMVEDGTLDLYTEYRVLVDAWGNEGYDASSTDDGDSSLYFTIVDPLGELDDFDLTQEPAPLMLVGEQLSLATPTLPNTDPSAAYTVKIASGDDVLVNATVPAGTYTAPAFTRDGTYTVTVTSVGEWGYKTSSLERTVKVIPNDNRMTFPAAITEIEPEAFRGAAFRIVDLSHSSGVSIGDYAFAGCENLALVALPGSGVTIGNQSFGDDVVFCCPAGSETEAMLLAGGRTVRTEPLPF